MKTLGTEQSDYNARLVADSASYLLFVYPHFFNSENLMGTI